MYARVLIQKKTYLAPSEVGAVTGTGGSETEAGCAAVGVGFFQVECVGLALVASAPSYIRLQHIETMSNSCCMFNESEISFHTI